MSKKFRIISDFNRQNLIDILPLEMPLTFTIDTSGICNFKCINCPHGYSELKEKYLSPPKIMSLDLYKSIIEQMKKWEGKLKLLRLSSTGEPFANPDIIEMIKIAKEANVAERIDLITNASLFTEKMAKEIVNSGLDVIRISIYSVSQKIHEKITRSIIDIDKIRENVAMLYNARTQEKLPYIWVKMFDSYDYHNNVFEAMYKDISDKLSIDNVYDDYRLDKNISFIQEYYNSVNPEFAQQAKDKFLHSFSETKICPRPFMAMGIDVYGNIMMCDCDPTKRTLYKSEFDLQKYWKSKELYDFRKDFLRGLPKQCEGCTSYRLFSDADNIDDITEEKLM